MRGDRQPAAHRPRDQRHDREREGDRAGREPRERRATGAHRLERELRPGGERDERDGGVRHELEGVCLVTPDQAEPSGPRGEADQQRAGHARQAHALRQLTARQCREQQEPEGERRARFDRAACGESMQQGHYQTQREHARDPAHGPQRYSRRRDFDNARERR